MAGEDLPCGAGTDAAPCAPPAFGPAGRLAEAAGETDFFRRAAKTFEAIDNLSAAEFAELAAGGTLSGVVGAERDAGFRKVMAEALVRRWLVVDADGQRRR